jgi:hypothetical protein
MENINNHATKKDRLSPILFCVLIFCCQHNSYFVWMASPLTRSRSSFPTLKKGSFFGST